MGHRGPLGEQRDEREEERVGRQLLQLLVGPDPNEDRLGLGGRLRVRGTIAPETAGGTQHALDELASLGITVWPDREVNESSDSWAISVGPCRDHQSALGEPRDILFDRPYGALALRDGHLVQAVEQQQALAPLQGPVHRVHQRRGRALPSQLRPHPIAQRPARVGRQSLGEAAERQPQGHQIA